MAKHNPILFEVQVLAKGRTKRRLCLLFRKNHHLNNNEKAVTGGKKRAGELVGISAKLKQKKTLFIFLLLQDKTKAFLPLSPLSLCACGRVCLEYIFWPQYWARNERFIFSVDRHSNTRPAKPAAVFSIFCWRSLYNRPRPEQIHCNPFNSPCPKWVGRRKERNCQTNKINKKNPPRFLPLGIHRNLCCF